MLQASSPWIKIGKNYVGAYARSHHRPAAALVVRGGPDTLPKLQTHARRTARAWCLDGVPLFGISVFCALDDIGPASLPGLLNSRLRTYRCIHYCPVSALRLVGVHLLPTGHRPHFTAVIASDEEDELRRLLACLGPHRENPYRMPPPRGRRGGDRDHR
ncbi:MAG: hypothetical protein ACRDTA_02550 [Pseudonocardiaceae bacterium]